MLNWIIRSIRRSTALLYFDLVYGEPRTNVVLDCARTELEKHEKTSLQDKARPMAAIQESTNS